MPLFYYLDAADLIAAQNETSSRLAAIENGIRYLVRAARREEERDMSAQEELNRLARIVGDLDSTANSTITLLDGIAQQLRDAGDDKEEIKNIADQIVAQREKLAQAVVRNTPSATEPEQPAPEPNPTPGPDQEPVVDNDGNPVLDENGNPTFRSRRRRR